MNRRLFFGSLVGIGAATSIQIDAERAPQAIQPDDVLVVELDDELSEEGMANLKHLVTHTLPGVKVLVCHRGMRLRLLRPESGDVVVELDGNAVADELAKRIMRGGRTRELWREALK